MIYAVNDRKCRNKPGIVAQTLNTMTLKTENHELKASLGYTESPKLALETVVSPKRKRRRGKRKMDRKRGMGRNREIRTLNEKVQIDNKINTNAHKI